jgi:hypothetical protein
VKHFALLAGAAAILFGVSQALRVAPCIAAFALVALVAWPIWRYQREFALFERRAILAGVLRQDSAVRRFFWSGHLAVTMQGLGALAWAAVLLALLASIGPWHWAVLVADALFLALAAPAVGRRLAKDVREEQVGLAARRWPLRWANLAVLAIAFFCVDYFVAGAPTRAASDGGRSPTAPSPQAAPPSPARPSHRRWARSPRSTRSRGTPRR